MYAIAQRLRSVWRHPANRGRRTRALARALTFDALSSVRRRPWQIELPTGTRVNCYPYDDPHGSLAFACGGWSDFNEFGFLRHYLRKGDAYLDVGADTGLYAMFAAGITGSDAPLDLFEWSPRSRQRLEANVLLNHLKGARIFAHAVSNQAGDAQRATQRRPAGVLNDYRPQVAAQDVPRVRLDDVVGDRDYAVGRLACDAPEPLVLDGAAQLMQRGSPRVWLMQVCPRRLASFDGWGPVRLGRWLSRRGYLLAAYDAQSRALELRPTPTAEDRQLLAISESHVRHVVARTDAWLLE